MIQKGKEHRIIELPHKTTSPYSSLAEAVALEKMNHPWGPRSVSVCHLANYRECAHPLPRGGLWGQISCASSGQLSLVINSSVLQEEWVLLNGTFTFCLW